MLSELITGFGSLRFADNILFVKVKAGFEIVPETVEEIFKNGIIMSAGKPYAILADFESDTTSTPEAREYGAHNPFSDKHIAYALIATSLGVRIWTNFFLIFNKPKVATRIFNEEKTALKWLQEVMVKNRKTIGT